MPLKKEAEGAAQPWRIVPAGDSCLIVDLGALPLERANRFACALAAALLDADLPGVTDVLPSMTALGVHYAPWRVPLGAGHDTPWDAMKAAVGALIAQSADQPVEAGRKVIIPVCYGGEYGPDLETAAQFCGISPEELVALHTAHPVQVFMLGFSPGHPYVGNFDERLAIPRRATPRNVVPKGSVCLANRQTVVYPLTSPGGWSVIGRTPLDLFDPYRETPCLLNPGDQVHFHSISAEEFLSFDPERHDMEHEHEH